VYSVYTYNNIRELVNDIRRPNNIIPAVRRERAYCINVHAINHADFRGGVTFLTFAERTCGPSRSIVYYSPFTTTFTYRPVYRFRVRKRNTITARSTTIRTHTCMTTPYESRSFRTFTHPPPAPVR